MTNSSLSDWLSALERVSGSAGRRSGDEWRFPCPAHDGQDFNLSIVERDGKILTMCHSRGCSHEDIRAALGIEVADGAGVELHRYEYRRADGTLQLTVCMFRDRLTGKKADKRPWREPRGVKGPHPLYRLPELLAADPARAVLVVEGEHTCDAARGAWPVEPVVTWAGGCKSWRQTDWTPLRGRTVTICADADEQGRRAARAIAAHLYGSGSTVSLVLPDGETGDDMADWLREGKDAAQARLRALKAPYAAGAADAVAASKGETLPTLTLAELFDRPEDATEWVVDGILPAGGFSALTGKPKSGKSTAARHLAHAIACGEPWLDRKCASGPVLYLALEEKVSEVQRQYMALGTPRDAPLHFCFRRTQGEAVAVLGATIEAVKPVLVVVDTLFRFQPVGDTSAYGDVLNALSPLHELARETGAHILAVHHERKAEGEGGDRVLGSTAIFGTVDVRLSIERRHADNVRVISSEGRYGDDLPETVIELRPDGSVQLAGSTSEIAERQARETVLAFLADHPGATMDDMKAEIGARWKSARMALMALVKRGVVTRSGGGKAGDPYRHHVAISRSRPNDGSEGSFPVPFPIGAEREILPVPRTGRERAERDIPGVPSQPPATSTLGDAYRRASRGE